MSLKKSLESNDSRGRRYRKEYKMTLRELHEMKSDIRKAESQKDRFEDKYKRAKVQYQRYERDDDAREMDDWARDIRKAKSEVDKLRGDFAHKYARAKHLYRWLNEHGVEGLKHY